MTRILIFDDDNGIREMVAKAAAEAIAGAEITVCDSAEEALAEAEKQEFDITFLPASGDRESYNALMPADRKEGSGIGLAKEIMKTSPLVNIIFLADGPQYAAEAFEIHASGYVIKPVSAKRIHAELNALRHTLMKEDKGLWIQAFGNFEVFYDGKPLHFRYSKTKELLAYLVDRKCAVVDNGEIRATLWDDEMDRTSYIKQIRKDLTDTLREIGEDDVIVSVRGGIGLAPGKVRCDYYDYLAGNRKGLKAYRGEYMQQYSWSEVTHGSLETGVGRV